MADVVLKKNRDRSLRRGHPWVFSGSVQRVDGEVAPGEIVRIVANDGEFLGQGYFNAKSQIQVRVLEWDSEAPIDRDWWRKSLAAAVSRREGLPCLEETNGARLVYAEADGLPGLIVDRYGDTVVMQVLTMGVEREKELIADVLTEILSPRTLVERSDSDTRSLEGLTSHTGLLRGEEPSPVTLAEADMKWQVDVMSGHKTGFYLDQRSNRARVAAYGAAGEVLDLFSYTGGFGITALKAGAKHVTFVDASSTALAGARANAEANGVDADACSYTEGNAFQVTRSFRDAAKAFDVIITDPPKLAPTRAQLDKAGRAYKDLNLMAIKLLRPGGILATFSCSGALTEELLLRIVAWAGLDAGRRVQVLERLSQDADHPVQPLFPESHYLKGLICRVL